MTTLKSKIDADADLATLRTDLRQIVEGYRVYVLLEPKVHLVRAADAMMAAVEAFEGASARLQARITTAEAAGKDTAAAKSALSEMNAQVAEARGKVEPVPDTLLALTPAGYPGNRTTLASSRSTLGGARAQLQAARGNAQKIVEILRTL